MSKFDSLKGALDAIGSHLAGISAGVKSMNANLAGLKGSTTLSDADAALLDGALSEAQDLDAKFAALEGVFAANDAAIPGTASPAPAPAADVAVVADQAAKDPAPSTDSAAASSASDTKAE